MGLATEGLLLTYNRESLALSMSRR